MSFSNFKSLGLTVKELQVIYSEASFVSGVKFPVSDYFRQDLEYVMREGVVNNSEFAICENMIYPILKETWKPYSSIFTLWSHQLLSFDDILSGFPEYILARRSPFGKVVFDKPYLLLVEAKQDNFDWGWGQCLAEMVTAQKLHRETSIAIFGIVSNGITWEFGKLEANSFTHHPEPYSIFDLEKLFAAVNYIFQQCETQLAAYLNAAA
ncbi:Restriction endonuclease [Tumidithrix helvetica PCC 7403]|uniref:hypothetical protein n=1 Tax=Tumidithrix helvetica TaxID=3457545 RepID=UPI003CC38FA6